MTGGDYFTHPDHMRGATRQKQNVMMHKQLAHFEKCVKDVKGTYFSPTHNNMLRDLVPSNVIVTSLAVLRELVKRDISRQHKKGIDINDNELVKHFDDFFQTIAYLRRLKRDFTDKIYSVLFEFFYPIALNDVPDMIGKGGKRMSKVKSDNLSIIKNNSEPTDDEEEIEYEMTDELIIQCNEMRDIIENLHHVNYRWEKLMANDEIDANFFDAETLQELRLYDSSKNFEYMLRLVPDIINKSLRAVELARKWWFNSDKFCKKLEQFKEEMAQMPRRRRPLVVIPESELNNFEHSNDEEVEHEPPQIEIKNVDPIERRRSERHKKVEATNHREGRKKAEAASKHWPQKAISKRDERSQEVVARNTKIYEDESHQETPIKYQNERHQKVVPNIESNYDFDDELEFSYKEDEEESQISSSDKESKPFVASKLENDNNIEESIIQLENSLKQVIARIGTLEEELLKQNKELHGLQKRQSRLDDLSSDVENAKDIKDNVYFKLKDLNNTKDELLKKISRSKNGSLLHTELKKTLASTEEDIVELKNAAKLHEFHHELLTSDLDVEMEMRPTLTGYSQHLQSKILEVERTLAAEMVRKHVLEKRLIIAKANLQQTIKEDQPPPERNAQPKFPSEQMYVYQSGLRNPPSIKPTRIPKLRAESNHSGTEHTHVKSPAIYKKPKKKSKNRPLRNDGSTDSVTASTLPELTPHGRVMSNLKVPGQRSCKSQKHDAIWENPELYSSLSNENVSVQYSDATSNPDVPSSPENHRKQRSLQGKRKSNKKDVKHNVLYTPQNGGRYRKSSGSQGRPHVTDRLTSTSDDGDTDFKQGLSDYSVEGSLRKEYKDKNNEKLNSTYRVDAHRQREKYLPSKQAEVPDKVSNSHRKQHNYNKRQKQKLSDESDEGVYKSKDKNVQPRGKHNTSRYPKHRNKQVDDRQKQQETPFSFDDDDALSIPEDPDAGSSESNDSDFSEELKAKQQKLRELRHRKEASNKKTSYDRPQRKPDRQPKAYDSKRDYNRREYQHYDTTPPPPPGYHDKRSRIPVKHY